MIALLLLAFISGLITILAPCIWPILPVVLSSTATGGRAKPLGVAIGISLSFGFFTLALSYLVQIFPIDPDVLRYLAVIVIGILGLILIFPQLSAILEGYVSRLTGKYGRSLNNPSSTGFKGGLITGIALGIVWTPCTGPILATIATLAAIQAVNFQIILVTIAYVIGVGIPLFIFGVVGRNLLSKTPLFSKYTQKTQQIFGIIMIITAIAIYTGYDRTLQANLLNRFPSYSNFINELESGETITEQLDRLRNTDGPSLQPTTQLKDQGPAPEIVGI